VEKEEIEKDIEKEKKLKKCAANKDSALVPILLFVMDMSLRQKKKKKKVITFLEKQRKNK
jgi:hypothetical protein